MTDRKTSTRLVQRALEGDSDAQCRLADGLMSRETRAGYREAMKWLRKAGAAHVPWAEFHLGVIFDEGLAGTRDRRRAAYWYERAASRGYPNAMLNLGVILANRRGAAKNIRRAMALYRAAALGGRASAAYNLGLYYSVGRGVKPDKAAAARWFRRAARLGDKDAKRFLRAVGEPK